MFNIYKILFFVFILFSTNQNVNAFDLKSLTEKIQKDIGSKLAVPDSGGSNPLGGMLKGLNQNKSNPSTNLTTGNSSNSGGSTKLAKGICEPNIPQTIKNLPKGNNAQVESDFGKKQNEIIKNILILVGNICNGKCSGTR
jgi:hypothetical protein